MTRRLSRELMCQLHQLNFDTEHREVDDTVFLMEAGTSTTADTMEKTFTSLSEIARSASQICFFKDFAFTE